MTTLDPFAARQFATDVVRRLREAGFQALWAGGCVRDRLLGIQPKDYDVATSALPDQVRNLFGFRRTLAIGAAFGVISVMGPKSAGHVEVATFRRDAGYSDGRHPDSVSFSTAEEDAQRRDFTINGLFYDPIEERVLDYVGGQVDLQHRMVRAIGDPAQRFGEDKLRMLRAVRFTATFDFSLDAGTLSAVQQQADDLVIVSAERIAAEMRRMLAHSNRAKAVRLLYQAGLLSVVLPEAGTLQPDVSDPLGGPATTPWGRTLQTLSSLQANDFTAALALVLRETRLLDPTSEAKQRAPRLLPSLNVAEIVCDRWRLANDERTGIERLLTDENLLRNARKVPWPKLQRILISADIERRLAYTEAVARVVDRQTDDVTFCREKLRLSADELNPQPLLTGNDLKSSGLRPGPAFKSLLVAVRDAQLEGRIATKREALEYAAMILPPLEDSE
jgi:tRNA nucleotidyltransferase/poly(A) polymerase